MKNNEKNTPEMDRRDFLRKTGVAGLATAGLVMGLTGCGGGNESSESAASGGAAGKSGADTAAGNTDPCSDLSGLTQDEKNMRTTLQYKAKADDPNEHCLNCNFWQAPKGGGPCGGCTLMKGPVHPDGHCISWVKIQKT